jgi:predicted GTPase
MSLRSTPEEQAAKLNESQNRYLADPQAGLELLSRLLATPEDTKTDANQQLAGKKLAELKRIIAEEFTELCKQDNLPNEAEMHARLGDAVEELTELASFSDFANKTVVGIGGGFSAGKSSFINSLIKKELLPNNVTPTTAIPTYLAQGKLEVMRAINIFGEAVPVDRDSINALCHDFQQKHKVQPKRFIKTLNINTPDFPFRHLAFVDTPGYSNANRDEIPDRQVALDQLRLAEVLVWVVDIANGTLRHSDIEFIREVRTLDEMETCIPIFVILNKADNKSPSEVQAALAEVKANLKKARIECSGIIAYDSLAGVELARDGKSFAEFLEMVGNVPKPSRLPERIARVFEVYAAHNSAEELRHTELLTFFNAFKLRMSEKLSSDEIKGLDHFITGLKGKIGLPKYLVSQFEAMGHRVEKLINEILGALRVDEEKPAIPGIPGVVRVRNGSILGGLKVGAELEGSLTRQDFLGVYVDCHWGDTILLPKEDLRSFSLQQRIKVGHPCSIRITDIHRTSRDVNVLITFRSEA